MTRETSRPTLRGVGLGPLLPALYLIIATTACAEPLVFDDWTIPVPEGAEIIERAHVPIEGRSERIELIEDLAFDVDGSPRWALRTTYPTPEIPEEIFENALEMLRERQPDYQRPDNWPERMPAIGNMVVDADGNLYVFHYVFAPRGPMGERIAEPPDEFTVDVYSPDGELLSAAVIDTMGWTAAQGDYVYTLGRDPETEEEVLRRYRLMRPWER